MTGAGRSAPDPLGTPPRPDGDPSRPEPPDDGFDPVSLASAVLESVTDGILVVERSGRIVRVNEAAERILRFAPGSLVGRSISELVPVPLRGRHAGLVRRFRSVGPHIMGAHRQLEGVRADGTRVPLEVTLTELAGDGSPYVCAVVRDVTERLRLEHQLLHQSMHDPLTGLANRLALQQRLDTIQASMSRHGGSLALLLMDVDHFKEINDSLGHVAGDRVLAAVASRMASVVRREDLLARLGGDEFAVVMELVGDESRESVGLLAERLRDAVSLPLFLEGTELRPSISIGVHVTDVPGPWDELMADADIGLYAAKAAGRDTVRQYEPEMRTIETHARRRRGELVTAVGTDQLVVHYQPIVELRDGAAPAMEALVRWQHPIEGLLAPGDFLPFADRHNLMRVIDRQVMLRALGDLVRARRARPELEQVWVNLSVQSLVDPELVDFVAESLAGADAAPSRLVVEITEEVMLVEGSTSVRTLSRLSELGVGLAVDDFGTGYSSLAQLGALPLTAVKLDRSLIARREGGALLSSIVGVVEALGLRSVAEGVETPKQLAQVAAAGCTFAQGYGLARPTELDQLIDGD